MRFAFIADMIEKNALEGLRDYFQFLGRLTKSNKTAESLGYKNLRSPQALKAAINWFVKVRLNEAFFDPRLSWWEAWN